VTGTLELFSLADLFQLLAAVARTGCLVIDHPQGIARVYFDKGKIVHAEFGGLKAEEAGPFVLVSRDTLFARDLSVNSTLLVKPAPDASL
jgi:hypothetical protein